MTVQIIPSGVRSSGITVSSGNELEVLSGGIVQSDTILSGGLIVLSSGAVLSGATVSSGGAISGAGALEGTTYDYGLISGVSAGISEDFVAGGVIDVESGGVISNVIAAAQAIQILSGGAGYGTVIDNSIDPAYTYLQVDAGGLASGTVISNGYFIIGGVAKNTVIDGYYSINRFQPDVAGYDAVESGGVAFNTVVEDGGQETVYAGGLTSAFEVNSGGEEVISSGGVADGGVINSGATLILSSGATASGVTISSSGTADMDLVISSGTTLGLSSQISATEVLNGVTLLSGAVLKPQLVTVLNGGALDLASGGVVTEGATVSSGGTISGAGLLEWFNYDYGLIAGASVGASSIFGGSNLIVESGGVISNIIDEDG